MAAHYDTVIRGGQIIDGTGRPGFEGDLALKDGRIAAVGKVEGQGTEEIGVSEFSAWSDTIAWETLVSITKRVPRLYRTALGT